MFRSRPSDMETVFANAEDLRQSDDPVNRLAGQLAMLEPTGFDDRGRLVASRSTWAFAHENLQTGVRIEKGITRTVHVNQRPRSFTMDATFASCEEGNGKLTLYVATLSLGRATTYGETYIAVDNGIQSCTNINHGENPDEQQHIEIADNLVEGAALGLLTTESKFSQFVASILESRVGVSEETLGARLNVVARRCLDGEQ